MDIDKTSLLDLNIFHPEEEFSIFHRLNFTRTVEGKEWLRHRFQQPFHDLKSIQQTQDALKLILSKIDEWPEDITNGTLMVMEKFFSTQVDSIPNTANWHDAFFYKMFHRPDFAIIRFSIQHFGDFIRGIRKIVSLFEGEPQPPNLKALLDRANRLTNEKHLLELAALPALHEFTPREVIYFGFYIRNRFKIASTELIELYGKLDAWYGMAAAMRHYKLNFPEIEDSSQPFIEAKGLFHVLLRTPVDYDVYLDRQHNFLFLTGANMAGKSTFIKAVGAAVYLAHLGMGVPAATLRLSVFEGILSNINLTDNVVKGESYFFNEVQRIKNTIVKINDSRKWLVLIDELFKGTNVQDAMKCSSTVIKGLINIRHSLFILSTHLYEIGEELNAFPNIIFRFFETAVEDGQLHFSYQLKEGISNDRLGYLILKREKVVDLLEEIARQKTASDRV